jgi:hypothetical protein
LRRDCERIYALNTLHTRDNQGPAKSTPMNSAHCIAVRLFLMGYVSSGPQISFSSKIATCLPVTPPGGELTDNATLRALRRVASG